MEPNNYIVIGSGPVGCIASIFLLERGMKVTMLDIGHEQLNSPPNSDFRGKSLFGNAFPYDQNEFLKIHTKEEKHWYSSKGLFGFSTVWGATWRSQNELSELSQELDHIVLGTSSDTTPGLFDFDQTMGCNCLNYLIPKSNRRIQISIPRLLVNRELCTFTGTCQSGCSQNAIWTSKELFKQCQNNSNFTYIKGIFVEQILSSKEGICLVAFGGEKFLTQKVVIAAGPVATAAILMKSGFTNKLQLEDNQIQFRLFFSRKKLSTHKKQFALSTLSLDYHDEFGKTLLHIQMYPHVENSLERVSKSTPKLLSQVIVSLFMLLRNHLFIGLVYFNSNASDQLTIYRKSEEIRFSTLRTKSEALQKKMIFARFIRYSLPIGIYPIPFAKLDKKAGESYHMGSAHPVFWDEYGRLTCDSRIAIAGSIALNEIVPGPITKDAMLQAMKLAKLF